MRRTPFGFKPDIAVPRLLLEVVDVLLFSAKKHSLQ